MHFLLLFLLLLKVNLFVLFFHDLNMIILVFDVFYRNFLFFLYGLLLLHFDILFVLIIFDFDLRFHHLYLILHFDVFYHNLLLIILILLLFLDELENFEDDFWSFSIICCFFYFIEFLPSFFFFWLCYELIFIIWEFIFFNFFFFVFFLMKKI